MLLRQASELGAADQQLSEALSAVVITEVLAAVPDALLTDPLIAADFAQADQARARYRDYLVRRLLAPRAFVEEAMRARAARLNEPLQRRHARR